MSKLIKKRVYKLTNPAYIIATSSIVGDKEAMGPISDYYEIKLKDDKLDQPSFEKAERRMMEQSVFNAIKNASLKEKDIDLMIGGDLLNQIVTSNYMAKKYDIQFLGLYSACAVMTESLGIGAIMLDSGYGKYIACVTSSHFSTSERQFRTPLELGSQRQTYSQWTATGAGCSILSTQKSGPKITHVCFGKVTDYGVKDIANMGAAMAPAAFETLKVFLEETKTKPDDYDLILTGDLGKLGSDILRDLMIKNKTELGKNYSDCGHMIYSIEQKTFQGGSGSGCSAVVFNSYVYEKLKSKIFKKVLFMSTGALMSTKTNQQGDSIPTIAHLVMIEA